MLRKSVYPKIETYLNQAAGYLHKQGFTPNQLTLAGLVVNFLAGWIYANGFLFLGGVTVLLASGGDLLDGALARLSGKVTKFGAFLDSTIDRYSDFCIFGGLVLNYAHTGQTAYLLLSLGSLMGAYVTSYSKARAENFIDDCTVGIFERPERMIALGILSAFPSLSPLVLLVLAIGTNYTAVQRILHTQRKLSAPSSEK